MGRDRLTAWGYKPEELPLGNYIYLASSGQDPIYRLGMLFFFETKNIRHKPERVKAFHSIGDAASEHDMDFDWADETMHAGYGKRWLQKLLEIRGEDQSRYQQIRDRCGEMVSAVVKTARTEEVAELTLLVDAILAKAENPHTDILMSTVTIVGSYIAALVMDVASIPLEGETVIGQNFHTTHGGKGSNMAACAARLGAATRFFGKVGRDAFGEGFVRLLDQEKIDGSALLFSDTKPTAVGFIIFSSSGSNVIVIDTAANGEFSPADITAHSEVITSSAVAVSPLEIPLATALAAASVAKAAGTKFILNPAPAMDLRNVDLSAVFALTPNELEARVCLGLRPDDPISDNEVVLELLRLGVDNVMLTRGGKGVLWGCSAGLRGSAGGACACGRHSGSRRCIQRRACRWSEREEEYP